MRHAPPLACVLLALILAPAAAAEELIWVEPGIDTSPPPLEQALEAAAREREQERKAEANRQFLSDIRRARELLRELQGLSGEVGWAAEAYQRAQRRYDDDLTARREENLRELLDRGLRKEAAARVIHAGLEERNGEGSALVRAVGEAIGTLQARRAEAAATLQPQ